MRTNILLLMDKNVILGGAAVVLILAVLFFLQESQPGNYDEFAQCLAENNATMYGTFWCSHCNDQKSMFGKSWKYVNYVECSTPEYTPTQVCEDAGIRGYPTWELGNGTRYPGAMPLEQLSSLAGCPLSA